MAAAYFGLIQQHVGATVRVWFSEGMRTGLILSIEQGSVKITFENGDVQVISEKELYLRMQKAIFSPTIVYTPACPIGEPGHVQNLKVVTPRR